MTFKIPHSVLVVIFTPMREFLLIERADGMGWQSVTGSLDSLEESPYRAALREVKEETGIDGLAPDHHLMDLNTSHQFEIHPSYRHRYAPGVTHNLEHVFSLQVPERFDIVLNPTEHANWCWQTADKAIEMVFSYTNANVILRINTNALEAKK
jgi:dATP pyrophosphohydrolase